MSEGEDSMSVISFLDTYLKAVEVTYLADPHTPLVARQPEGALINTPAMTGLVAEDESDWEVEGTLAWSHPKVELEDWVGSNTGGFEESE